MLKNLTGTGIVRDTGIIFGGFAFQLVTQIGWFILAVRYLGPEGYGLFASVTAVTIIVSCFVGWGCESLLIRDVTADPATLAGRFGQGLIVITGTALAFGALCLAVLPLFTFAQIGIPALVVVMVADLIFGRYLKLCIAVNTAVGNSGRQSLFMALGGLTRLVAVALAAALADRLTVAVWADWYCAAAAVSAVVALGLTIRQVGWPRWRLVAGDGVTGFAFSAEAALQAALKDLDKPIVAECVGAEAAGYYAAAMRLVETTLMPINALGFATYARFCRLAAEDHRKSIALGLRLLPAAAGYGLAAGLALLFGADILPWLFGPDYAALPPLVRLVAPLPLFYGVYVIGADVLTSLGRQGQRLLLVGLSLGITVVLVRLTVPDYGADGAALVRVGLQAVVAVLVWGLVRSRGHPPGR